MWDNCSTESKNQLESIHIEAARVITGATKLCSIEKLFADLGWESLQKRRNKHKLVIFYKILHGIAPTYLSDIVPPLIQDTTTYNLRNAGSSLNSDLQRKNIVPSPFCRCGVFESRNHFFYTCPLYSLDRLRYLPDNLDNLTSNELLFGCENQSDEFNESLFLNVQEFLIRSGRFG